MAHYLEKVLNKAKSKSPHEMVAKCHAALEKLGESSSDKQQEELGKYLGLMKVSKGGPMQAFGSFCLHGSCKLDCLWCCLGPQEVNSGCWKPVAGGSPLY